MGMKNRNEEMRMSHNVADIQSDSSKYVLNMGS